MIHEVKRTRQVPGEGFRRWFTDSDFDLIVWYEGQDEDGPIAGFQLCYDKQGAERALTWRRATGFSHEKVDDGETGRRCLIEDDADPGPRWHLRCRGSGKAPAEAQRRDGPRRFAIRPAHPFTVRKQPLIARRPEKSDISENLLTPLPAGPIISPPPWGGQPAARDRPAIEKGGGEGPARRMPGGFPAPDHDRAECKYVTSRGETK